MGLVDYITGKKRKTPKEIIESRKERDVEHVYVKLPRKELIDVSLKRGRTQTGVKFDARVVENILEKVGKKQYTSLHTHVIGKPVPSPADIEYFIIDNDIKTEVIAQQDPNTGKVKGYFILRKTKRTKPLGDIDIGRLADDIVSCSEKLSEGKWESGLKDFAKKQHLRYRFIPAKGYTLEEGRFVKKKGFEKRVAALTTAVILALILFVPNLFNILFITLTLMGIWSYFKFHQNL